MIIQKILLGISMIDLFAKVQVNIQAFDTMFPKGHSLWVLSGWPLCMET